MSVTVIGFQMGVSVLVSFLQILKKLNIPLRFKKYVMYYIYVPIMFVNLLIYIHL